jgi:hypothetical protein
MLHSGAFVRAIRSLEGNVRNTCLSVQLWFHAPHTPLEEIPPYVDQYRNVRDHGARK